jgi:hypothetical protein
MINFPRVSKWGKDGWKRIMTTMDNIKGKYHNEEKDNINY